MFGNSLGFADPGLTEQSASDCQWVNELRASGRTALGERDSTEHPQPRDCGCAHPPFAETTQVPWLWEGRKLLLQLLAFFTGSMPTPVFHSRNKPPAQDFKDVCVSPWQRMMMVRNAKNAWGGSGCFPWRQTLMPPDLNIRAYT